MLFVDRKICTSVFDTPQTKILIAWMFTQERAEIFSELFSLMKN